MCKLITKLNRELRGAFLLIGIIALAIGLSDKEAIKNRQNDKENEQGYQTREFDDIW